MKVRVHERGDRRLDGVLRLIEEAGRARPLGDVLASLCQSIAEIAQADVVSVYVLEVDAGGVETLVLRGNVGFPDGAIGSVSLRVGEGLRLVDATGTALTRERLVDALSGRGVVYDRAREYRRAVDEALFGLGEQRYGALVDLLVQLRQPQLSKRPSEKALSAALTEALPPLDQAVVADVAEAFRSLEEDRDELAAMTEAHTSAQAFLDHYRRYAAIAARLHRSAGDRRPIP